MNPERPPSFLSATCHPRVSRRQVLAAAGGLLAAGLGARKVGEAMPDDGNQIIQKYSTAADDPWAIAHGIRAIGRDFAIAGGRRGVDHLLEHVLASIPAHGTSVLAFTPEVEVHPNAFLAEAIVDAGVAPDHGFLHQGTRRTVRDVVAGARALFRPRLVMSEPNALPWSLIAFTRTTPPLRRRWTNTWGEPVDLDAVVEGALELLERASLPLADAMRANRPEAEKAPVHSFTCGGTHMLYALVTAVHAGYGGKNRRERVRRQVDLMVWRMGADIDLIEQFYGPLRTKGDVFWYEVDTQLKILGHAEECVALAVRRDLVRLTPAQEGQRRTAVERLRRLLSELERRGLDGAKTANRELFRQLVGDTCHARHGLHLV